GVAARRNARRPGQARAPRGRDRHREHAGGPHGGPRPHHPPRPPRRRREAVTGSRVLSLGHYQPSKVLTNDDLAQLVDTNDAWIRDRVGIAERRIAAADETVADMACAAAEKALASSGLSASDIDLVA